jgi:hypothetical protein
LSPGSERPQKQQRNRAGEERRHDGEPPVLCALRSGEVLDRLASKPLWTKRCPD